MSSETFAAFQARFDAEGQDPEVVVKLFVEGMLMLEQDPELGSQMMALLCSKKNLDLDADAPAGLRFRRTDDSIRRLRANINIARSYAGGDYQAGYGGFAIAKISLDKSYSAARQGVASCSTPTRCCFSAPARLPAPRPRPPCGSSQALAGRSRGRSA